MVIPTKIIKVLPNFQVFKNIWKILAKIENQPKWFVILEILDQIHLQLLEFPTKNLEILNKFLKNIL